MMQELLENIAVVAIVLAVLIGLARNLTGVFGIGRVRSGRACNGSCAHCQLCGACSKQSGPFNLIGPAGKVPEEHGGTAEKIRRQ